MCRARKGWRPPSTNAPRFSNAISLPACESGQVIGRIDGAILASRFDGSVNGYLDWICMVKSIRHAGTAQALLAELRRQMKQAGASQLIALMAANEDTQRFYRAVEGANIHDEGIWIDLCELDRGARKTIGNHFFDLLGKIPPPTLTMKAGAAQRCAGFLPQRCSPASIQFLP